MGRERDGKRVKSRPERNRPSTRRNWRAVGVTALALFLIGLIAGTMLLRRSKLDADPRTDQSRLGELTEAQAQPATRLTDIALNAAVTQLFSSVNPLLPENQYFPPFAKEKIGWILSEHSAGRLSIIFLKNTQNTNLDVEDLMASGKVEGKSMIVIARPLRERNQPMNYRLLEADDALRACEDKLPCEPLKRILLPTEMRR